MKKLLLLSTFIVLAIFGTKTMAQSAMPKISDGTNTYWYYMKSHGDFATDGTNRAAKVLTKNAAGYYYGVEAWNNKSTWAKFKVVAGSAEGKYDIVTEDGLFLNKGVNGDISTTNVFKSTDNTDWTFTATSDSRGVAAYRIFNSDNLRLQLKVNTAGFSLRSEYTTNENNNLWNFIPVENPIQVSNETTSTWYRIQNLDADANSVRHKAYLLVNTADGKLIHSKTQPENWKFLAAPTAGKYYIVNQNGKYITQTLSGTNYATVDVPDASCEFEIYPTFGVHSDKMNYMIANNFESASSIVIHPTNYAPYNLINYTGQDQASKWMINSAKEEANNAVTAAQNRLAATKEGNDPGMFSTAKRGSLQAAIDATIAKIQANNVTFDDANTLTSALTTYNNAVVVPQLSTEGNERWYFLQGQRPANTYLTSTGAAAQVFSYAVVPNDNQLWKFVASTTGTANGFAMVNKATGTYLDANTAYNANIFTVTAEPTNNLRFIASDIYSDKTIRFWIENTTGSTPAFRLHAGNTNVLNWNGNAYDYSSWLILDYAVALKVFLQTAITNAQTALTTYPEGTEFGQNTAADRTTLTNAIAAAQAVYSNSSATETAIKEATTNMNAAISAYNTAAKNLQKLLSANTSNYRWYRLKNRNYTTNDIITTNGVAENGGIIAQNSGTAYDNELWRFEINEGATGVKIINKATGLAIKENGTSTQSTLVEKTTATEFAFTAVDTYWGIGRVNATQYQYLHRSGSSTIVGWELSAVASQWALQFVEETAKPVARTITVSSADTNKGTAAIIGSTESTVSTAENVTVKPIPVPGFIFSKWTDAVTDADVSTEPVFTYTGTTDIQLKANFATLGTVGLPLTTDDITPVYYYIQSASDGSHVFSSYSGDFRNNVMIAPTVAGNIIHNKLSAATSNDHALWQIVSVENVTMLKNKATGWFMNNSRAVGITGSAFTSTALEAAPNQYLMNTIDNTSYTNTWKNNLCDRLSLVTTANSMLAWYFIVEPGSQSNYSFTTGNVNTPASAQYIIRTANKVITVDGVENFEVFSISGQKLNKMQALERGIYIVRIQNQSFKVTVK